MFRAAILLLVCSIAGCGSNSNVPPMIPDVPTIDVDDPKSIEAWETSFYNFTAAKIVVIDASYLHGDLSYDSKPVMKRIPIQVAGARDSGIAPSQQQAIHFVIENEKAVFQIVRDAIYADYRKQFDDIRDVWGNEPDVAPLIQDGTELDAIVTFGSYYVHHPTGSGPSYLGIQFWGPWTADDQGVLLQDLNVIDIGQAYSAMPSPSE